MGAIDDDLAEGPNDLIANPTELPFPPVTRSHIINCSYHCWYSKYRAVTPKARVIPLTQPFLDYLRADGIVLPSDDEELEIRRDWDDDSGIFSASDNADPNNDSESEDEDEDVAAQWRGLHNAIKSTIAELGGKVHPKLNWSAPKDATWMNANSMECRTPSDIYLLLKSSDFITHDLEHAFDDTISTPLCSLPASQIPYHLALRKTIPSFNPSVEFRCFVRNRKLLCISQRDVNHYEFLGKMQGKMRSLIQDFFELRLRDTFEDANFVFDVYVPNPYTRVWLVDVNPWAPRTDPLLFSWMEILNMPEPPDREAEEEVGPTDFVRVAIRPTSEAQSGWVTNQLDVSASAHRVEDADVEYDESDVEDIYLPELRLVKSTDPEAYSFSTPQYSAHKLPKDVVDASQTGEGLREFARDWNNVLAKRQNEDAAESSEEE